MAETLHGTAVLVGANGVLIRGVSGAGKSRLAFALIERGGRLIADDNVHLAARSGRIIASAPASISGLIELRGRGLIGLPHERSGVIRLIVDIVSPEELERMPESDQLVATLLEIELPRQAVADDAPHAVALVLAALGAFPPPATMGLRSAPVWG